MKQPRYYQYCGASVRSAESADLYRASRHRMAAAQKEVAAGLGAPKNFPGMAKTSILSYL